MRTFAPRDAEKMRANSTAWSVASGRATARSLSLDLLNDNAEADLDLKEERSDVEEFELLVLPHVARMLRVALRLAPDRSSAEDLVQDALLAAWRSFHRFERGTDCRAWLFKIMLNLATKRRRRERRFVPLIDASEQAYFPKSAETLAALDALSEEHRTVLLLAAVEGFTCREIAQMLDLPIGTVMSRLSRARAELRRLLGYR